MDTLRDTRISGARNYPIESKISDFYSIDSYSLLFILLLDCRDITKQLIGGLLESWSMKWQLVTRHSLLISLFRFTRR